MSSLERRTLPLGEVPDPRRGNIFPRVIMALLGLRTVLILLVYEIGPYGMGAH